MAQEVIKSKKPLEIKIHNAARQNAIERSYIEKWLQTFGMN